jgi:hypothetical protein
MLFLTKTITFITLYPLIPIAIAFCLLLIYTTYLHYKIYRFTLGKKFSPELLDQNAGYVARELERHLLEHKRKQEQGIFEDLVKSNTLTLVVSDDDEIGFEMPQKDIVAKRTDLFRH